MKKFLFCLLFCSNVAFAAEAPPHRGLIIASIKPLHSLVSAVMEGSGEEPLLLVDGKASLHSFSLKPSQAKALQQADMVFYMGDDFELFLDKSLANAPKNLLRSPMQKADGVLLERVRLNANFEPHDHHHEHGDEHDEDHDEHHDERHAESGGPNWDLHLWLSIKNAKAMVDAIARDLTRRNKGNSEIYWTNARKINERLDSLQSSLEQRMRKLQDKPFIVFHDAYQYFETGFGLKAVGSITLHPETAPSAKHLAELREKITRLGAICVFREPQFDAKVVDKLVAGTGAKSGMLDPEGALLSPGKELYFQLMENIADGLTQCLEKQESPKP